MIPNRSARLRAGCPDHGSAGILPAAILQDGITSNLIGVRCSESNRREGRRNRNGAIFLVLSTSSIAAARARLGESPQNPSLTSTSSPV